MKMLKSRKALSPVVATIILIAVTVAVSLAVAIWMGSLATPQEEQLNIIDIRLDKTNKKVYVEVTNIGGRTITITDIRIDDVTYANFNGTTGTCNPALPYDLPKGSTKIFEISYATWPFKSGVLYYFKVVTARGNQFGPIGRYGPS